MICIDPGKSGGIAKLLKDGSITAVSMPETDGGVYETLNPFANAEDTGGISFSWKEAAFNSVAYLEGTVKYAGTNMPGSAGIAYGDSCGFVRGVLIALQYRVVIVPPKDWQKALGLGGRKSHPSKTAWKNHLKNRAGQLFPNIKVTLKNADALLILEAARRGLIG